ncbi:MAG: hypothetical protein ACM3XM_18375, partial [Mycobacterium leprae]
TLSAWKANILTINQSLPLQGVATVIVSMETRAMTHNVDELLEELQGVEGVERGIIVGQS